MSADANPIDERRELVDDLRDIDGVLDVDFTRDGYRTLWVKYEKRGADDLEVRSEIVERAEPAGYGFFPSAKTDSIVVERLEYIAPPEREV